MDMRDIAKLAGVSSATVSRVINKSRPVNPETAARVLQVIKERKFVPNGSATALKSGRSGTYGLIIPDITNPFFPELFRCFESLLAERNLDLLLATTGSNPSRLHEAVRRMLVRKVDGLALLASEIETGPIEAMMHNRVPLVTMDRRILGRGLSDVSIHGLSGMSQAVKHLYQFKHRKIGYIGGSAGRTISDHRKKDFLQALSRFGLSANPQHLRLGNYRISGGESAMEELLTLPVPPTAIITANDLTAIGALRVIRKHGLSVPGDFSIVGFDDIELSDIVSPPLTTLRLRREELAKLFVNALEFFNEDPHRSGTQYHIRTTLIVRESTGPARKQKR